jgi:serine/threonine protein kinase
VVLPKGNIALSHDGKVSKLCFKILNSEHIQAYCGLKKPSDKQISSIIDDWIYMAPKSKNIISAYEVFKDEAFYMQLTEYCEGYDNIYQHLKMMNLRNLQDGIPQHLLKMVYQYIIQISNAFAIAHSSNLMHGDFNLSQVICDENFSNFKMINFRPWLVKRTYSTSDSVGNRTKSFSEQDRDSSIQLSMKECIRIARARDLYQFG